MNNTLGFQKRKQSNRFVKDSKIPIPIERRRLHFPSLKLSDKRQQRMGQYREKRNAETIQKTDYKYQSGPPSLPIPIRGRGRSRFRAMVTRRYKRHVNQGISEFNERSM
ncbi:hypothetical protein ACOME3_006773 [Neoechinorhynchus agilis]